MHQNNGLEVVAQENLTTSYPEHVDRDASAPKALEKSPSSSKEPSKEDEDNASPRSKLLRRRRWLIWGGVALVLVIVAAVLGGVLGSRALKIAEIGLENEREKAAAAAASQTNGSKARGLEGHVGLPWG